MNGRPMQEREVVAGMAVFSAVVEGGSLVAAARKTGLTPSAVSKLVTRLERDFGTPLVRRTTRSMTVTDAGQRFYERARGILEALRAVEQELASEGRAPRGRLCVSAPQLLGQTTVLPSLLGFLKRAPAVTLNLDMTDRVVDMVGERVDIAVRVTSSPPSSFVAKRVGTLRRVLCASPGYLRAHGTPRAPGDLTTQACLLLSGPGTSDVWRIDGGGGRSDSQLVRVTPRARLSNVAALREAALAGLGIADLPRYLVNDDLRARRLTPVLAAHTSQERGIYVIYAAGAILPLRVREAVKHLVPDLQSRLRSQGSASA